MAGAFLARQELMADSDQRSESPQATFDFIHRSVDDLIAQQEAAEDEVSRLREEITSLQSEHNRLKKTCKNVERKVANSIAKLKRLAKEI